MDSRLIGGHRYWRIRDPQGNYGIGLSMAKAWNDYHDCRMANGYLPLGNRAQDRPVTADSIRFGARPQPYPLMHQVLGGD